MHHRCNNLGEALDEITVEVHDLKTVILVHIVEQFPLEYHLHFG